MYNILNIKQYHWCSPPHNFLSASVYSHRHGNTSK